MLLAHASNTLLAAPDVQAIHLLHAIRKAVEVILVLVLVVGLLIGFFIGRAVGRRR